MDEENAPKRVMSTSRFESIMNSDLSVLPLDAFLNDFVMARILNLYFSEFLQYLRINLLLKKVEDIKCTGCDANVKEVHQDKMYPSDFGFHLRCTNSKCRKRFPLRVDYIFEGTRVNLYEAINSISHFLKNHRQTHVAIDNSQRQCTLSQHYSLFREVMVVWYQQNLENYVYAPNEVVELDEALFGRKMKYGRGYVCGVRVWCFGMIGRDSGVVLAYPVPNRQRRI